MPTFTKSAHVKESERANDFEDEHPQVLAPPPLIFGIGLGAGLLLDRDFAAATPRARLNRRLGIAAVVAGAALGIFTLTKLQREGTSPNPFAPDTKLVTSFPFTWTRNPAYVGATCVYIGVGLASNSLRALTFLPIVLAVLDRIVVDPEERYLERRFGNAYRTYRERVPRWF